jgi:hypothetical protein
MTLNEALEKSSIAVLEFDTKGARCIYYATNIRMYRELFAGQQFIASECVEPNEWYLVVTNKDWRAMGYESK